MQTLICLYTGCICFMTSWERSLSSNWAHGSLKMYLKWTLDIAWYESLKSPTISLNLASGVLSYKGRLFNEQVRTLLGTQGSGVGKVVACLVPLPQCRCLSEMWPPEEHLDMEARPQPYRSELRTAPVGWGRKGRCSPLLSRGGGRTLTSSFGPSQQLPVRAPALPCLWRPEESAGVCGLREGPQGSSLPDTSACTPHTQAASLEVLLLKFLEPSEN